MNAYPKNIEDLLQSDLRRQIFDTIASHAGRFSIINICEELERRGVKASRNMVQQFLQALLIRGYINAHKHKEKGKAGRSDLQFELIKKGED